MSRRGDKTLERGFTLIELLTALGIFLLVCGAAFTLLGSSQQQYQTESQLLTSFQERDSGWTRSCETSTTPVIHPRPTTTAISISLPVRLLPGVPPLTPRLLARSGPLAPSRAISDMIVETNPNPQDPSSNVQWIRYKLQTDHAHCAALLTSLVCRVTILPLILCEAHGLRWAPVHSIMMANNLARPVAKGLTGKPNGRFPHYKRES